MMMKLLLLLTSIHVWSSTSQDCNIEFKTKVFTYSKSQDRPLRIKMRQLEGPHPGHPCNLSVILPDNQTVTYLVSSDGRPQLTASPDLLKQSLNLTRKRSDLLWLDVEAETKSGIYNIAGEKIFAFQTPSKDETILSQTENITCKGNLDLIKTENFKMPLVGQDTEVIIVEGQVKLTKMFSLCTQYNALYNALNNVSQHLKHAIHNVTVGQQYLQFVISTNETLNEDIEVECDVDGGDGIKEYKIKFKPNLSQCKKTIKPIDSTNIIPIVVPIVVIIAVLLIVTTIVIFWKRRHRSEGSPAIEFRNLSQNDGQE